MPLWIVIMVLGAAGCGFLFLKAREQEAIQVRRKVKQGSKSVKAKAKQATGDIGMPPVEPHEVLEAEQPVSMSRDVSSQVVKQLEEILKEKEV